MDNLSNHLLLNENLSPIFLAIKAKLYITSTINISSKGQIKNGLVSGRLACISSKSLRTEVKGDFNMHGTEYF